MNFNQKGFTLLELVVAVSIAGTLVVFIAAMFVTVFTGSKQQFLAIDNVDQARLLSSQFLNQLRNATTGVDGSYPIGQADDTQIIFYSKDSKGAGTVNRYRYYLNGTKLYQGIVVPTGNPLTYNLASEKIRAVQYDVKNTPVFIYYDDTYGGSGASLSQPVNLNSIKFVTINLTVLTQVKDNNNATFSISEGVAIRNLKTNLGN